MYIFEWMMILLENLKFFLNLVVGKIDICLYIGVLILFLFCENMIILIIFIMFIIL